MNIEYNAIIPEKILRDNGITESAKLIYGELTTLIDEKGNCFINKKQLMNDYGLTDATINSILKTLIKKGYIEISNDDIVEKLKSKNLKGYGYGDKVCEWCGISTTVLCEHHYPIPKSKGGKKVVKICSNCHQEYHYNNSKITLILTTEELEEILTLREINVEEYI